MDAKFLSFSESKKPRRKAAADLGFNVRGGAQWVEPASINGTGGLREGEGEFCAPEANAFKAICSLKPV